MARRLAGPHRPGEVGGRRADDEPLVRRPGDAAPVLVRRRHGLLRQPLPRDARLPRRAADRARSAYSEFATDPCRSLFQRVFTRLLAEAQRQRNVNLAELGERFIAMTETPIPVAVRRRDAGRRRRRLRGARDADDRASAPRSRERRDAQLRRQARAAQPVPLLPPAPGRAERPRSIARRRSREPAYMHSFGLTERCFVLAEFPFVVNPLRLALSGRPYIENYRWKPELGTRFTLIDRRDRRGDRPVRDRRRASASTTSTRTRTDGEVVVDICVFDDAGDHRGPLPRPAARRQAGRRAELRAVPDPPQDGDGRPRAAGRRGLRAAADQLRALQRAALPLRVGRRRSARAAGWTGSSRPTSSDARPPTWSEPGCYPGEPVFVAAPGRRGRGRRRAALGRARRRARSSFLLVLDAATLDELARAEAPHHIPFGFHGQFARA